MNEWVSEWTEEEEPVFPNPQDDQEYSLTVNYSITVFLEYKLFSWNINYLAVKTIAFTKKN